jgi:hypothetical protein
MKTKNYALYFLLILPVLFQLFTIREGHRQNEDWAGYLRHAKNIATGQPYTAGRSWKAPVSSQESIPGPAAYPPGAPIVFAAIYPFVGLDLEAYKVCQVLIFGVSLFLLPWMLLRSGFTRFEAFFSAFLLGFMPQTDILKNNITSDLIFFLPLVLALLANEWFTSSKPGPATIKKGIVAAAAIMAAVLTRSVGVLLLPTLICHDLFRHRRLRPILIVPVGCFLALYGMQKLFLASGDYLYLTLYPWFQLLDNFNTYRWSFVDPWKGVPGQDVIGWIMYAMGFGTILGAFATMLRSAASVFFLGYGCLVLILPVISGPGDRYILPMFPFFGALLLRGSTTVGAWIGPRFAMRLPQVACAVVSILMTIGVLYVERGPLVVGVGTPGTRKMYAFIREQTPPDARVAVTKGRALNLFTDRVVIKLPPTIELDEMDAWFQERNIGYFVVKHGKAAPSDVSDCPKFCRDFNGQHGFRRELSNAEYTVYSTHRGDSTGPKAD